MNLIDRIQLFFMLRRADNFIRNAKRAKDLHAHLNRPHVQSDHLISFPVPKKKPNVAPDYGIGPFYAAALICIVFLVYWVNTYYTPTQYVPTASLSACMQVASK